MMIVHSDVVDPSRPMLVRGLENLIGFDSLYRIRTGAFFLMISLYFLIRFISSLSTRPDSYPMLDSEAVRYRLSGIAHYKIRKAL